MKREKKIAIVVMVAFFSLSAVILLHSISPYITPSKLVKMESGVSVQVVGKITNISRLDDATFFTLTDGKVEIEGIYNGTINIANLNQEVVIVGNWKDGVLRAKEILRKCHTEYTG